MTPQLKFYNTLTRSKQAFTPLDPANVRMYVCGITPYDFAHIGNLRTAFSFDILFRILRQVYGKNHVTYVTNYTDIDDKIVERAKETGKQPFDLAAEFIEIYENSLSTLSMLEPSARPRVSQHMQGIVKMVDDLLVQGFAYVTASGDVMFDVPAFEKLPNPPHDSFGHIARRTFENVQARVEEDAEKRDPRDFPVWKANAKSATKLEQAFEPETLGAQHPQFIAPGRPGWHIECSVMSEALLGTHYHPSHSALFDIHGGGEDLAFPHHSCEIAQTEALHPTCTMCSVWMHGAFLTVEGEKMSKSLGNFLTISDALEKYSPEAIRLWLLQTHYRKPVDFSDAALKAAEKRWQRYQSEALTVAEDADLPESFMEALGDDLNTPKAMAVIDESTPEQRRAMLKFFGLEASAQHDEDLPFELQQLLTERQNARISKQWVASDLLREELKAKGILVEDTATGQTWRRL